MLEKMFSGQFPIRKEKDGSIFIDRSGSFFDFILDYLRGNMIAVDDLYFDDNTRKRLIKEAEYYQLEGMKNILAFKSNEVRVDDDCKQEIVEIIENVVQRKDHIRNVLNYSEKRNVNDGQLLSGSDLCSYYGFQHCSYHNCVVEKKYKTNKDEVFRNKRWDGVKFDHVVFKHNITFKNCSFLKAIFFIVNLLQMQLFRSTSVICLIQTLAQQTLMVKSILTALIFDLLILVIIVT